VLPVLDDNDEHEEEEPDSDDKKQPDQSDVIEWMLWVMGEDDPDEFLKVAHHLGVPIVSSKFTPQGLSAMADQGNFGCTKECVIHHFLSSKGLHVLPSDKAMQMLRDGAIKHQTQKIKMDNVVYVFLHCPLERVVRQEIAAVADIHLKWCDISFFPICLCKRGWQQLAAICVT